MKPRQADLAAAWLIAIALLLGLAVAPIAKPVATGDAQIAESAPQRLEVWRRANVTPSATASAQDTGAPAGDNGAHPSAPWFRDSLDRL